jgi:hypothetical protein
MQASYSLPKSLRMIVVALAALISAILIGGVGGYVVRGAVTAPLNTERSVSSGSVNDSLLPTPNGVYEQSGRPASVYQEATPFRSTYVQGGRPQVVYDEIARLPRN